jgi:uncharacterized protein
MTPDPGHSPHSMNVVSLTGAVRVASIAGKGRGLVALRAIAAGSLIDVAPVVPLTETDRPPPGSVLYDYPFHWDDPPFVEAIALGIVSLANHSSQPNAAFEADYARREIRMTALRDVLPGEEVLIDYDIPLWFDPC